MVSVVVVGVVVAVALFFFRAIFISSHCIGTVVVTLIRRIGLSDISLTIHTYYYKYLPCCDTTITTLVMINAIPIHIDKLTPNMTDYNNRNSHVGVLPVLQECNT